MSRFGPCVVATDVLKKLKLELPQLKTILPKMIAKGMERLRSHQNADGGWGWWKKDTSNPMITSYVLDYLIIVNKNGRMTRRGINFLMKLPKGGLDFPTKAYIFNVLARYNPQAGKKLGNQLFDSRARMTADAFTQGLLIEGLLALKQKAEAKQVLAELLKKVKVLL